jgi:elongation factor P
MQTTDIRKGLRIQIDGVPFHVVEHQFVKPGKGQAFTRARIRNLVNGNVVERTWKSGESVEIADVEERKMTYSWAETDTLVFMDTNTGDQIHVEKNKVGDDARWQGEKGRDGEQAYGENEKLGEWGFTHRYLRI